MSIDRLYGGPLIGAGCALIGLMANVLQHDWATALWCGVTFAWIAMLARMTSMYIEQRDEVRRLQQVALDILDGRYST